MNQGWLWSLKAFKAQDHIALDIQAYYVGKIANNKGYRVNAPTLEP